MTDFTPSPALPDHRVRELAHSRPRLRQDLRFVLQKFQGEACYVMEDPLKRRFFRVGIREHGFLQRLDGSTALRQIVAQMAAHAREDAFSDAEAASMVRWLADTDLLVNRDPAHAERMFQELHTGRQPGRLLQKTGALLFFKLPLGNPNRFLDALLPWLRWSFGWSFFMLWLAMLIWGALAIGQNWARFSTVAQGAVSGREFLASILVWIGLKAVHELWHGLACKRYGLSVPEFGLMLLLLITPLAYVDASSSLRLRNKWQRMSVSAAGLYIEFFFAAILALIWSRSEPGWLSNATHHGVLLASVVTVFFNINPLMRFDGYYLMSDWLEIPNLYAKGQACTSYLFRRYVLRLEQTENPLSPKENFPFIASYGVAAALWRVVVFFSLVLAAGLLLKGAGLLLAIPIALIAIWTNLRRLLRTLLDAARAAHRSLFQVLLRPGLLLLVLAGSLFGWQIRDSARAVAVVELDSKSVLRTECPGFVRQVLVKPGQRVEAGQLLVELENPAQTALLAQLRLELSRSQTHRGIYLLEENLAAVAAEEDNLAALGTRIIEMESYVATLTVRAPRPGLVFGRDIENLTGSYLRVGQEILTVAAPDAYKLTVAIPQESIELFRENAGKNVPIRFASEPGKFSAQLQRLEAGASREIPHFALAAISGGPLTVEMRPEKRAGIAEKTSAPASALVNWQLTQPHFLGTIPLGAAVAEGRLGEGSLAWVKVYGGQHHSLAKLAQRWMGRVIGRKMDALGAENP